MVCAWRRADGQRQTAPLPAGPASGTRFPSPSQTPLRRGLRRTARSRRRLGGLSPHPQATPGVARLSRQAALRAAGRGGRRTAAFLTSPSPRSGRPGEVTAAVAAVGEGPAWGEPLPVQNTSIRLQAMAPPGVAPARAARGRRMTRRTVARKERGRGRPPLPARAAGRSADLSRAALRAWERLDGERRTAPLPAGPASGTRFPSPSQTPLRRGQRRTADGPFSSSVGWFLPSPASDPRGRQTLPGGPSGLGEVGRRTAMTSPGTCRKRLRQ